MKTLFKNGSIVTPNGILENANFVVDDEKIIKVNGEEEADKIVDLEGNYVIPGFIDIHSDMIESLVEPRSTAMMDFEMALKEAEKQLLLCGITTIFHSVSMYKEGAWGAKKIRRAENVKKLAELVEKIHAKDHLIHHRLHLRYEIDNKESYKDVEDLLKSGKVHLLSFMDHSPGQGQYRNLEIYRKHLPDGGKELTDKEFEEIMKGEKGKGFLNFEEIQAMASLAQKLGIAVASHDDDCEEKIKTNKDLGISISEFPINIATAHEAVKENMMTVLGAPNILLGGSHSGNLSAAEAILQDLCSVLCSDYYPSSLLYSLFYMKNKHNYPLYKMVNMVSLNPAISVGIQKEYGSIEEGKLADFIVVEEKDGYPIIKSTFIHGKELNSLNYRV